jgi:hypothetical protein
MLVRIFVSVEIFFQTDLVTLYLRQANVGWAPVNFCRWQLKKRAGDRYYKILRQMPRFPKENLKRRTYRVVLTTFNDV